MARESLATILLCHAQFLAFCAEKETVLDFVAHVFPPEHALRQAVTRALWGDALSSFRLAADDACCQLCGALGEDEFRKTSGKPCTDFSYGASMRTLVSGMSAPPKQANDSALSQSYAAHSSNPAYPVRQVLTRRKANQRQFQVARFGEQATRHCYLGL